MAFIIRTERKETENKTIRFPLPLVKDIENVMDRSGISFSGFVIQACRFALDNLDPDEPVVRGKE